MMFDGFSLNFPTLISGEIKSPSCSSWPTIETSCLVDYQNKFSLNMRLVRPVEP